MADVRDRESLEKVRTTRAIVEGDGAAPGRDPPTASRDAASTSARRTGPIWLRSSTPLVRGRRRRRSGTRQDTGGATAARPASVVSDAGPTACPSCSTTAGARARGGRQRVHVGQDDVAVSLVRRILGPRRSSALDHGPDDLAAAAGEDVTTSRPARWRPRQTGRARRRHRLRHSGQCTLHCSHVRDRRRDASAVPTTRPRRCPTISSWCAT